MIDEQISMTPTDPFLLKMWRRDYAHSLGSEPIWSDVEGRRQKGYKDRIKTSSMRLASLLIEYDARVIRSSADNADDFCMAVENALNSFQRDFRKEAEEIKRKTNRGPIQRGVPPRKPRSA